MELVDTHAHLNFAIFEKNIDAVLKRAQKAGVTKIVVVATTAENAQRAVALADQHPQLYAVVGIHPHHVFRYTLLADKQRKRKMQADLDLITQLVQHPRVVGVGETGLDVHQYINTKYSHYRVTNLFLELQEEFLAFQLQLARKHSKAVILHNRGAASRLVELLEHEHLDNLKKIPMVFHCAEPAESILRCARRYQKLIGIAGDATYLSKKHDFVTRIPDKLLVLETDAPFFVPMAKKTSSSISSGSGVRSSVTTVVTTASKHLVCEPSHLKITAQVLASVRTQSLEEISAITTANAKVLFGI